MRNKHPEDLPTADVDHRLFHCHQALHGMYAFLDGEMEPGQHSALQHHLEQCSPCLEAFEFEAELKTVISHRCKEDVPQEVVMKVTQALMIQIKSDNSREPK